jgi:hypothetical protein
MTSVTAPKLGIVSFEIRHFSGYTVAMCENDGNSSWWQ